MNTVKTYLNDLSNIVCFPNKTENLNIYVFDMTIGKNESNILTKDKSCECNLKLIEENVI